VGVGSNELESAVGQLRRQDGGERGFRAHAALDRALAVESTCGDQAVLREPQTVLFGERSPHCGERGEGGWLDRPPRHEADQSLEQLITVCHKTSKPGWENYRSTARG